MKEKKIAVLGLGYVGLPLALQLSFSYNVVGYDIDDIRIKELRKGIDKTLEVSESLLKKQQNLEYLQRKTEEIFTEFFSSTDKIINYSLKMAEKNLGPLRRHHHFDRGARPNKLIRI